MSSRKLQAEYQKSVLPDFSKYPQILHAENEEDPVENKKWLGAMFWRNLVSEKMVEFGPLS
jgi:hypothetical protein